MCAPPSPLRIVKTVRKSKTRRRPKKFIPNSRRWEKGDGGLNEGFFFFTYAWFIASGLFFLSFLPFLPPFASSIRVLCIVLVCTVRGSIKKSAAKVTFSARKFTPLYPPFPVGLKAGELRGRGWGETHVSWANHARKGSTRVFYVVSVAIFSAEIF